MRSLNTSKEEQQLWGQRDPTAFEYTRIELAERKPVWEPGMCVDNALLFPEGIVLSEADGQRSPKACHYQGYAWRVSGQTSV